MRKSLLLASLIAFSISVIGLIIIIYMIKNSLHMETLTDFFVMIASLSIYAYFSLLLVGIPLVTAIILLILGFALSDNHEKKVYMAECLKGNGKDECNEMWNLQKM